MVPLFINGTSELPLIDCNNYTGTIILAGKSVPEGKTQHFDLFKAWVQEYIANPCEITTVEFRMEYFNINTSKYLLWFLYQLNDLFKTENELVVKWFFEKNDDDMLEVGEDMAVMVDFPFQYIETEGSVVAYVHEVIEQ